MKSLNWMDDALCAQTDPDLFFPEGSGRSNRQAKKVCAACPVLAECGEHAATLEGDLSYGYRHGAWGGQSPRERAQQGGEPLVSDRDQHIIHMTDRGMTPKEIAAQLGVSDRTVARVKKASRQQEAV